MCNRSACQKLSPGASVNGGSAATLAPEGGGFIVLDIDGQVHYHQGISRHNAEYTPMRFPVFKG